MIFRYLDPPIAILRDDLQTKLHSMIYPRDWFGPGARPPPFVKNAKVSCSNLADDFPPFERRERAFMRRVFNISTKLRKASKLDLQRSGLTKLQTNL